MSDEKDEAESNSKVVMDETMKFMDVLIAKFPKHEDINLAYYIASSILLGMCLKNAKDDRMGELIQDHLELAFKTAGINAEVSK